MFRGICMHNKAFTGDIEYLQIIDENGVADQSLFPKDISDATIAEMYKKMLFSRMLDAKILSLQRQGRAVTYAPLIGEEATQIGSAMAMRKDDIFVPSFRQHGVYYARGYPLDLLLLYWKGFEDGAKAPSGLAMLPVIVPVSTQMPHAAGIAFAQRYKNRDVAVVAYVGDGGTSEGDFYESLNFAGVWKAPLVIVIENNQWAISMPRSKQSAAQTLAQKAIAAGIDAIQVDGNDVVAVYEATKTAIEHAREGPTVIECVTYRMSMHTTADDPTKYRSDAELEIWKKRDPLARINAYLAAKGLWNADMQKKAVDEYTSAIDSAVEKAETFRPDPKSIFEHVYSYMPETLKEEMDEAVSANFWER